MTFISKFSSAGYRVSGPRRHVYMVLERALIPMTPSAVHRELVAQGKSVGIASIYRTLDLLVKLELAKVVLELDGTTGYVVSKEGHNHTLVCQNCHKIYEFASCTDLSPLIKRVQTETQFLINGHILQLFGTCPDCQRKDEKNA
ncbi:MAG: Fur family transcriptional regulator [Anaerolineaceae bacterium]